MPACQGSRGGLIFAPTQPSDPVMAARIVHTSDPNASYRGLKAEIDEAIHAILNGPAYVLGAPVADFETTFARYIGVSHGVGVNNGTDAIHLALRGLGIGEGDEVITVSHTAVATVAAIVMAGATPVLCDVDPLTRTIDPQAAEALITPRTKAIIAVHLYGHPADLGTLMAVCDRRGLSLIEDCAQCHGASWKGRKTGSFGRVSTFSFYPTKNLGAIGDAGLIATNDDALAARLRLLRQYGWEKPQFSVLQGWNSRMDPLQAGILSVKLRHLDAHTARRRELAARYGELLNGLPITLPTERADHIHVHHLYVIELENEATRDRLRAHLAGEGIQAGIHYPFGVHEQPAYRSWIRTGPLPVTERLARTVLSLPLYPELGNADQERVSAAVRSFFNGRR